MNLIEKILALIALAVAAVSVPFDAAVAEDKECRIAIVRSWDLPEYNTALEGFLEILNQRDLTCKTLTYNLKGGGEDAQAMLHEIRSFRAQLIFTVGSRATALVSKNVRDIPVVFSMVLYPAASSFIKNMDRPGANVTGAAIDIPIGNQFLLLSRIVPNLKRVGVMYSPEETQLVVEEAKRVATSMGLELITEQVSSETDVPDALKNLERQNIQALWSVADGKVFSPQSTRYIIEQALRKALPFMGPHRGFARAGALVALTPDYKANGRQAGEIAIRVLKGANPSSIPVATPRDIELAINQRVANHIRLSIPPSVLEESDQVFE
ncbi:MAG: hypothetical protein C4520_09990 [Candidatus Abyssobacteria bacterium SURF_5]|uniref:ABC transporter substrate-binding protein n=1 Tax=Abyssobacteria bacterium (strain SURF_5) TaxID=2093360 RepID=A0A3A4NS35_ABYX5|nr:MAG: hypothetical protein C4520_09990 [Candidatus Abyssubacteria bacterium SURF_5]